MKNYIYLIFCILLSTNSYGMETNGTGQQTGTGDSSSEIERGKWYRFTRDFFSNCVSTITEVKNKSDSYETSGASVSSVNADGNVKTMSSCITNTYNPLQSQVDRTKVTNKGCKSELRKINNCSFSLVPATHNQKQKTTVSENDFYGTAEFTCNNGTWQNISASTSCQSKDTNKCASLNIKWGSNMCEGVVQESRNNTTVKLLSTNSKEGYVYVNCTNGNWQISPTQTSFCKTAGCPSGKVSWYDQYVIDVIKDTETTNGSGSSGRNELISNEDSFNLNNQLPFENNKAYRKLPKCIGDIKSFDNGLTGYAEYKYEDKTYFKSLTEAAELSNFLKGRADFKCIQGKWIQEEGSICKRESSLNCIPKTIRVVNGIEEKMYQCNFN